MDLLHLLSRLTLLARLLLAVALLVVVSGRPGRLEQPRWACWLVLAIAFTVMAVDNAILEVWWLATRHLPEEAPLEQARHVFYNATYLLHAVLSAATPAVLIGLLGQARTRRVGWLVAGAAGVTGAGAVVAGALASWDLLLDSTRVLAFIGVPSHLAFLALVLVGHLPAPDRYLVWFMAVRALFVTLTPIQEVFYQMVGRESAHHLWHLSQSLQLAMAVTCLCIVLLLVRALSGERRAGRHGGALVGRLGSWR